jgi:lysyl-tRNA synthetase class 2
LEATRAFFRQRGFVEVETPALVAAPGQEVHLEPLRVCSGGWLITSPEHHMKRLLARGGLDRIYQICHCFRGGERSAQHRPEFTMVEWYRAGAGYDEVVGDVESLAGHVAQALTGSTVVDRDGSPFDLTAPWPRLTVRAAFQRFAGVDLREAADADSLRRSARRAGCGSLTENDDWETGFHKLLVERVEPGLSGLGTGVHLLEYPAALAALARLKPGDPSVAERFESYAGNLELANGFGELADARQQRRRFGDQRESRRRRGLPLLPVDEPFLRDLARMPEAAGVALGFDRLFMLISGARRIDDVLAF